MLSQSGHADYSIMLQHASDACSENLQNLSSQPLPYAFDITFFQFPLPLFVLADNGCAAEAGRLDGSAGLVFKLFGLPTFVHLPHPGKSFQDIPWILPKRSKMAKKQGI